jgi:large subunit ribosomal protein L9
MQVLLRQDVRGVGRRGDIVDVSSGYARNYLVPSGLALEATAGMATQSASMKRARGARDAQDREAAQAQATTLGGAVIGISARAAQGGRLFGSVSELDIVKAIKDQKGIEVDAHKVNLGEHLKETGSHSVNIELFDDVVVAVTVEVIAQG